MNHARQSQIETLRELPSFMETLNAKDEQWYNQPIADGKWSVKGIIAHLWFWDQYFLKEALEPIAERRALTLQHLNYDLFNRNAWEQAKHLSAADVVASAISARTRIIHCLESIPAEEYDRSFTDGDGNAFVISAYIDDFAAHDLHHVKQIEQARGETA